MIVWFEVTNDKGVVYVPITLTFDVSKIVNMFLSHRLLGSSHNMPNLHRGVPRIALDDILFRATNAALHLLCKSNTHDKY